MSRKRKAETQSSSTTDEAVVVRDCPGDCTPSVLDESLTIMDTIVPSIIFDLRNIIMEYLLCTHQMAFTVPIKVGLKHPYIHGRRGLVASWDQKTKKLHVYTGITNTGFATHWSLQTILSVDRLNTKPMDVQLERLVSLARSSEFTILFEHNNTPTGGGEILSISSRLMDNSSGVPGIMCYGSDVESDRWVVGLVRNDAFDELDKRWLQEHNPEVYVKTPNGSIDCLWSMYGMFLEHIANLDGKSRDVPTDYTSIRIARRIALESALAHQRPEWFINVSVGVPRSVYSLSLKQLQRIVEAGGRSTHPEIPSIRLARVDCIRRIISDELIFRKAMPDAVPDFCLRFVSGYLY